MTTVNIHEAKTHLSRLVERAAGGDTVVIAKAGRPLVRLVPVDAPPPAARRRLGFLAGAVLVPDDFDRMGGDAVAALFEGGDEPREKPGAGSVDEPAPGSGAR